jgi:hypothetical protein
MISGYMNVAIPPSIAYKEKEKEKEKEKALCPNQV